MIAARVRCLVAVGSGYRQVRSVRFSVRSCYRTEWRSNDGGEDTGEWACRSVDGVGRTVAGGLRVERRCRSGLNPRNDRYHATVVNCGTTVVVKHRTPTNDINHGINHAGHHAPVNGPVNGPDDGFIGCVHSANSAIGFRRRKPPAENLVESIIRSSGAVQRPCPL
jgi:hypothetical protein